MVSGPPILAAFMHPGLLLAGLAAVSVPILIHLLARRWYKRVRWAAIEFLIEADKRNRRRLRMEQLVLLLLRCLAVLLIALVISRPYLGPRGWGAVPGGRRHSERIVLLDDSYSMGYLADGTSCFDDAKRNLIDLIHWVRRKAPDDTVTVLRASAPDMSLAAGLHLDERSTAELIARIEALQPSQQGSALDRSIAAVGDVLADNPDVVSATVFVISDFQRIDWLDRAGSPGQAAGSPLAPLAAWAGRERSLHVVLVAVGRH